MLIAWTALVCSIHPQPQDYFDLAITRNAHIHDPVPSSAARSAVTARPAAARSLYRKCTAVDPRDSDAYYNLAILHPSPPAFRKCLTSDPTAAFCTHRAQAERSRADQAAGMARAALGGHVLPRAGP